MWKPIALCLLLLSGGAIVSADGITVAYPVPFALVQRETPREGEIPVRGTCPGVAGAIEARFNGGPWQRVDAAPAKDTFAGKIRGGVGQGDLEVRAAGSPAPAVVVKSVAVGDLFLVTGQSNADGRGTAHIALDAANPYVGVKYRRNAWSRGDDPSANDTDDGSPWPIVLNDLMPREKVPMGFIAAAVGSTVVKQWRRGGDLYTRMLAIVKAATGGTMRVKCVLYYQGENDITHWNKLSVLGDYAEYKANLMAAVTDFQEDLKAPVLVGQITNLGGEVGRNDSIRRAQQEVWRENPHARIGAVVYDILPTDGVHYREEGNMRAFARRWALALRAAVYGEEGCACPALRRARLVDPTTIRLEFDRDLAIESWSGAPAAKALGFLIRDGDKALADADIVATTVDGRAVTLRLGQAVSTNAVVSQGSGARGQGAPVLRDAANKLPIPMLFAQALNGGE